ncbi:MAG: bifunctional adenosylcobinamide kinase/adenosylcobinamide-phosphate guanylyltransferase [Butyrivibrio sp.]|nr:bifunctional adenosylcobinamide kinase/adenosylcobinamide-phosphate guanylyltransferase [Acetatifactor muris]MCM1558841.1 bifunctional adenosylcobinamide kinase/adenosylcobinamide-phosphate guanylyltransferase [Butyrivibrio sp.]
MLYLVTGGSGSGKSEYAESLAGKLKEKRSAEKGRLLYVATMYSYDRESDERIARHRLMRRGKGFSTIECYCGISRLQAGGGDVLLVECMSNLLANEMYLPEGGLKDRGDKAEEELEKVMVKPLLALAARAGEMVVVTNEVFSDGVRYDSESEQYRALLGRLNERLAARADAVVESVFSIPVIYKGEDLLCDL